VFLSDRYFELNLLFAIDEETQHYDGVSAVALLDDGRCQDVGVDVVAVVIHQSHQ